MRFTRTDALGPIKLNDADPVPESVHDSDPAVEAEATPSEQYEMSEEMSEIQLGLGCAILTVFRAVTALFCGFICIDCVGDCSWQSQHWLP